MVTDPMKRNAKKVLNAASRVAMGLVRPKQLMDSGWKKEDVEWLQQRTGMLQEQFVEGALAEMESLMGEAFAQMHGKMAEMKPADLPKALDVLAKHWKEFANRRDRDRQAKGSVIDINTEALTPEDVVGALTGEVIDEEASEASEADTAEESKAEAKG